jgi:hypothetical protein
VTFSFELFYHYVDHFATILNNVEAIKLYLCPGFSIWMLLGNNQVILLNVNSKSFITNTKCSTFYKNYNSVSDE